MVRPDDELAILTSGASAASMAAYSLLDEAPTPAPKPRPHIFPIFRDDGTPVPEEPEVKTPVNNCPGGNCNINQVQPKFGFRLFRR